MTAHMLSRVAEETIVLVILIVSVAFVIIIVLEAIREFQQRRQDKKILNVAEEARRDFE